MLARRVDVVLLPGWTERHNNHHDSTQKHQDVSSLPLLSCQARQIIPIRIDEPERNPERNHQQDPDGVLLKLG